MGIRLTETQVLVILAAGLGMLAMGVLGWLLCHVLFRA